jgi:predicted RNase H-like HicB family nuclease
MKIKNLSLDCIMVEDPKVCGYTAFFKIFPNIISEGETVEEAENNLLDAFHDVFKKQIGRVFLK